MPNGLALATLILIAALVLSYVITVLLSLLVSPSHTKRKELKKLVDSLDLKKGDVFVDLGCGDGRVVFSVAKEFKDVKCIGYEISPVHIMIAKLSKMILFPFSNRVRIIPENFLKVDLSNVDVVYVNWGRKVLAKYDVFLKNLEKKGIEIVKG
jgi:cyclopropane fatty-acyl-phospholipid synthase-like methyltransferase